MSPLRPDIVECWVFRLTDAGALELLLIRRAGHKIFPGIWQCVTGGIMPGERVTDAVYREVAEETGLRPAALVSAYDLDQVGSFYDQGVDAIVSSVVFAVRVATDAEPAVSDEHVDLAWVGPDEARERTIWPAYRESIERIERLVTDPEWARWFEIAPDGDRIARRPAGGG